MENTVDWYCDRALELHPEIKSDGQLGVALGKGRTAVSQWRTKRAWPSDTTMIHLAVLAGVPAEQALLDLNTWRAQSSTVAAVYSRIAATVKAAAGGSISSVVLLAAIFSAAAPGTGTKAAQITTDFPLLYNIMRFVRRWLRGPGRALPTAA